MARRDELRSALIRVQTLDEEIRSERARIDVLTQNAAQLEADRKSDVRAATIQGRYGVLAAAIAPLLSLILIFGGITQSSTTDPADCITARSDTYSLILESGADNWVPLPDTSEAEQTCAINDYAEDVVKDLEQRPPGD